MSIARHRARRVRHAAQGPHSRRRAMLAAGTALAVGVTAAGVVLAGWDSPATTSSCPLGGRPLRVVAAPEIAPSLAELVRVLGPGKADEGCARPVVTAEQPARTARALATDAVDRPDVWVPDSSVWARGLAGPRAGVPPRNPSVAASPFVLAVPASVLGSRPPSGAAPSVRDLVPGGGAPVRWDIPDPRRSASGVAALLMAQAALADQPDAAADRAVLLRGAELDAPPVLERALRAQATDPSVVPTTEQRATAYNEAHPRRKVGLAYSAETSLAADYPFIVLAGAAARRKAAFDLLKEIRGDLGRRLLAASGFRDRFGVAGAALSGQPGVDATTRRPRAPRAGAVRAAVRGALAVRQPSRLLTVLDVSGSMANPVPGAGGLTRLDIAVRALATGLATYQDDTVAGLWTFSTDLTRTTDYRVLVPPVSLGTGPDGTSGRARLATALSQAQVVPDGGTGLYDTVLAAVRAARSDWDPTRVNSVVVVTDGANQDDDGIGLGRLLRTLRAERDRSRPVTVYAVAYGPSADHGALRRIVAATGGRAYRAVAYRDLPAVIADAIGRRAPGRG